MKSDIRQERLLKLKMITAINLISSELKKRKIDFTNYVELFEMNIDNHCFFLQIEGGEEIQCWINISNENNDNHFDLCENGILIEKFINDLNNIIDKVHIFYIFKEKIEIQIFKFRELIEKSIDNSGLSDVVEVNDYFLDEFVFEKILMFYNN